MASSDIIIKKNIEDIDDISALEKILQIQPKTYKYIDSLFKKSHNVIGFIAQQIKEVIPEAFELAEECATQELYKIIQKQETIINYLQNKINILENNNI